jgi:hypothetical protein
MIEVLSGMPEGVTGIRVSGRLRGDDLREFKPAMEKLMKAGELRIVEVIASDYQGFGPGGLVEDVKLGLGALFQHHAAFNRARREVGLRLTEGFGRMCGWRDFVRGPECDTVRHRRRFRHPRRRAELDCLPGSFRFHVPALPRAKPYACVRR